MKLLPKWSFILTLLVLITSCSPATEKLTTVLYVIDGDTIVVAKGEKVRYLGINAPEKGQPFFREAKEENCRLVEGKKVRLELDKQPRDQYGRTLAYVWVGEVMVNLELVRSGLAHTYIFPPNVKYQEQLLKAEEEAREKGRGIWSYSENRGKVKIVNINADAPGDDNQNLNGEWVEIKNLTKQPLNMKGWTLNDEANQVYTFGDFTLEAGESVSIYSGCGTDTPVKLYWQCPPREYAIWNNLHDTAFLRDAAGKLMDFYRYGF